MKPRAVGRIFRRAAGRTLQEDMRSALLEMERLLRPGEELSGTDLADLPRALSSGGKRLRPILAFLCYRIGGGRERGILPLMCMLELMHTASLIHDDIVDGALYRRGCPTISSARGNDAAARCGDYLLAQAMAHLRVYRGTVINEELVGVSERMCLGELMQLETRYALGDLTRERYFEQVRAKTAGLIAASCYTGAIAGGLAEAGAARLRTYGEHLGIAFQLRDDLLDFTGDPSFGKLPGQDLRSGVFTLPVIRLAEEGLPAAVRGLLEKRDKDDMEVSQLVAYIKSTDALEYVKTVVLKTCARAAGALAGLPEGLEKDALAGLAEGLCAFADQQGKR
jgi:geranylgeranyl pyrophosphate synthase